MLEMQRRRISMLIVKKINRRTNPQENMELEEWAGLSESNRRLLNELLDKDTLMTQLLAFKKPDLSAAWEKLVVRIPVLQSVPGPNAIPVNLERGWSTDGRRWWAFAAVLLIVAGIIAYYTYHSSSKAPSVITSDQVTRNGGAAVVSSSHKHDLPPAGHKLKITLPGGDSLDAANVPEKGMVIYDNMSIRSQGEGTLVYDQKGMTRVKLSDNKVTTPPGGWYTVILPDGTKVRLNAASSLSFKTSFGRNERKVRLRGEAYFEVAHKPSPFIVEIEKARDLVDITATGTCFNVTAYKDDDFVRTTMLRGNVRISDPAQTASVGLHAGQQYLQYLDGKNQLQNEIDTLQAVGWKNDMFVFKGESLPEVMRQISRWYDATVVYQSTPDSMRIAAKGSRRRPLSSLLERIAGLGGVHFTIEDHRIIVSR
ncbi:MAG TPA: FecR domain-containing protein [Puia sp.]|nr:FecR domain-containing protein [Puia sp.]